MTNYSSKSVLKNPLKFHFFQLPLTVKILIYVHTNFRKTWLTQFDSGRKIYLTEENLQKLRIKNTFIYPTNFPPIFFFGGPKILSQ